MKFCTKCGTAIEPGDQFCTSCGTSVAQMQASEAPTDSAAEKEKVTEKPATTQETGFTTTSAAPAATDLNVEKTTATASAPESDAVDETKASTSATQAQEASTTTATTAKEAANDANSTTTSATIDKEKVSATVDQTKEYAKSYWNWLTTSVKHPFSYPETTNPLYGITTFVIFAIVSALILIVSGRQTFNALDRKILLLSGCF